MRNKFDIELQELNLDLIRMGGAVEEAISKAVKALEKQDLDLAKEAIAFDSAIDDMEREIERRCLKLLLQQQPVASDLRRISAALKMITDMERIGDQAADISELTIRLAGESYAGEPVLLGQMAKATTQMVKEAINAYVNSDVARAEAVIASDDTVDGLFDQAKDHLINWIRKDSDCGGQAIDLIMVAKYFERIGDHAVNIAEWVIFSITGKHKED